jgi:ABC-type multidrug transport system fused ATPase/permease subunit
MPSTAAAAMAATPAGEQPLDFFLQPLFLHGVSAAAHLILAVVVVGRLLFRRLPIFAGRAKDSDVGEEAGRGVVGCRCYAVAACITWALAAFQLVLAAYSWYADAGYGWSRDADADAERGDAAARAVAWLLLAAYLQFGFGQRWPQERFPAPLRLWWALFMLLSVVAVGVHAAARLDGPPVPGRSWAHDAVSVVAAVVLLSAGFLGRRDQRGGGGHASEEPLLIGAHEAADENSSGSAADTSLLAGAGFLSVLTFSWMAPLLAVGHAKKTLVLDDVPGLELGDSVAGLHLRFKKNLEALTGDGDSSGRNVVTAFKLTKALLRTLWWHVAVTALYALVYNVASYVGPYLIDSLVQYLNGDERYASRGQLLVLVFIVAKVLECLSQRHWFFRVQQAGMRARSALVAAVYQKSLALSGLSRRSRTNGEMINIVSVDADRVDTFAWFLHEVWLLPLQVGMAMFILYSTLGLLASLAALGATVVIMLANVPPGNMQEKFQEKLMGSKDVRMKATSEILQNMRILKLQGWEMKFLSKIIELRKTETNWLKKYLYTSATVTFVFWGTPTFVAVVTFGACILMRIPLESGKVLSALATFRVLQEPIYGLPDFVQMLIKTKVSLDRIASFLCLEELPSDAVQRLPSGSSDFAININNGCFSWEASPQVPTLKDLNFKVTPGMRVAVCGTVGSGKSSLISCILGEIPKLSGEVQICGKTAYVSQSAWIQSGKIQENILFGMEMNEEKYDRVLESCSLKKDLEILPFGDQTIIGERGINLSGGQKQRIQIARALYQDADIYLFDDPFSAVDAHTGSHLFKVHGLLI